MALYFYPPQPQLTLPTYPPHRKTAAIAQTCYQFNTPFAIVRAISDTADSHASHSFEEFITLAGKHSAEMVRQIVQHID